MDTFYLCLLVAGGQTWFTMEVKAICHYTRPYGMFGADCHQQDFEDIPQHLMEGIEILSATKNRIRMLSNKSLQRYSSLKYLYLTDNFIQKIEPQAFAELNELEVLDLRVNGIISFPTDLPLSLRKLYLSKNERLENVSLTAAYNLEYLELANCELRHIPSLGVLPNLKDLNLTNNPLEYVNIADIAPLCRLERLYLPPTLYKQPQTQCPCQRLLTWAKQHSITMPGFNCTLTEITKNLECDMDFVEERLIYKACLVAMPASSTPVLLYSTLVGTIMLAAVILICWWRKSRRKKNCVEDQKRTIKNGKAADTLIM